ncbi:hypothetical protein XcodCFBP4690_02235 [Xanthomonas codiaei]|uniref:Uncharacterized protein n=1 Tax=Xanthomonas codiaei TaxID=56463 RepID=A0A2S7CXQ0_9XANT|nr:hypothetical protein XcodCFBP4690_02235 [Xanthomonas codiaei]
MHLVCIEASRLPGTLTPTPAPRPGPRHWRGRSKAHAPMARKPCLLAPAGEGLWHALDAVPSPHGRRCPKGG